MIKKILIFFSLHEFYLVLISKEKRTNRITLRPELDRKILVGGLIFFSL
jgi:hypothetical protein